MLICRCGATLDAANLAPLDPSARALLDIIYSKSLNLLPFPDPNEHLPIFELSQLKLRTMLRAIRAIGNCWAMTMAPTNDLVDPVQIILSAAQALSDWPENYFRLLASLGARESEDEYDVRRQFSPLYNALLRERKGTDSGSLAFFRAAFMEFIGNHQNVRAADPRLMPEIQQQAPKRYQTRAEVARSLRVDPRTVKRLLTSNVEGIKPGKFAAVDSTGLALTGAKPTRILAVRTAAAKLGVPVSVFRKLVDSHVCPITHRLPGQLGYDERDLNQFSCRLLANAEQISRKEPRSAFVSLRRVMRLNRYSTAEKTAIVAGVAKGVLKIFAVRNSNLESACISLPSLAEFIACERATSDMVTASDASATLGCSMETIKGLIRSGQLTRKRSGNRWLVSRRSVDSFRTGHVKLSLVATALETSSRRLMRLCRAMRLPLTYVRSSKRRQEIFIAKNLQERLSAEFQRAQR
jgi:hypothetical protein